MVIIDPFQAREQTLNSLSPALRLRFPLLLWVIFYLLWAFLTSSDYGMTFDESGVYARGVGMCHYLTHDDFQGFVMPDPHDDQEFYGHLYSVALNVLNPSQSVEADHRLNMLFALLIFIVLYELLLHQTHQSWLSLLGPVFLFLCPRFMGDIPANPKDMPFAVFYFLALGGIYLLHRRPQTHLLAKALGLGVLFGLTQASRMLGFTLYGVYLLFEFYFFFFSGKTTREPWLTRLRENLKLLMLVFITSCFLMMATWPYLGSNFLNHLVRLLHMASGFTWRNNVLFMGEEINSAALPWTYLPVWVGITTPLFILFLLALSFRKTTRFLKNEVWVLGAIALLLNFGLYLALKPVLYDGLRHFLFFLPLMVLLAALAAIDWMSQPPKPRINYLVIGLVCLNMAVVVVHLVRLHPYEYVYFNELAGGLPGSVEKFDNDYWGASFKEAVAHVRKETDRDPAKTYWVNASGNPYQVFYYFPPNLKWTDDITLADYYLSTSRDGREKINLPFKDLYRLTREGVTLNYDYRLK